jgi:hypothetical protein
METEKTAFRVKVEPGICGFCCTIVAIPENKRGVRLVIEEPECKQIRRLAGLLKPLTVKDLFVPFSRNPIFNAAERAGCHASCAIPTALAKAAEVATGMALPRSVRIDFVD